MCRFVPIFVLETKNVPLFVMKSYRVSTTNLPICAGDKNKRSIFAGACFSLLFLRAIWWFISELDSVSKQYH